MTAYVGNIVYLNYKSWYILNQCTHTYLDYFRDRFAPSALSPFNDSGLLQVIHYLGRSGTIGILQAKTQYDLSAETFFNTSLENAEIFTMTSSNENIIHVTGPLWSEYTGH